MLPLFYSRRFVIVALFLVFGPQLLAQYTPKFFKAPPTTSIILVDCKKDRFGPSLTPSGATWRNFEVTLVLRTIQGIVNRTSSTKLYLLNLAYTPGATYYEQNLEQWFLDDGIVPAGITRTTATLDNTKTYPALHYLLNTYGSLITGKVLISDITQNASGYYAGNDDQLFAAITACGQLDAIPTSVSLASYLASNGYSLTTREDITGLTGTAAWSWALANYFQPDTTRAFIGRHHMGTDEELRPHYPVTQVEYFIATRAFVDTLDSNNATERSMLSQLYNATNYPLGTPSAGRTKEDRNPGDRGALGYPHFHLHGPNFTVHSSLPSVPSSITSAPQPQARPYDNNDVFVAFYVTDGDNISFSNYRHYWRFRNSPDKGTRPITFGISPILFDLNPELLKYYSGQQASGAVSFLANMSLVPGVGQGFTNVNGQAWSGYTAWVNNLLDNTNGLFRGYNCLERVGYDGMIDDLHIDYAILDYHAGYPPAGTAPNLRMISGFMPAADINGHYGSTEQVVRYFADNSDGTKPLFVVVSVGDGSNDPFTVAKNVAANLVATPNGKDYKFVSVGDLLTTWEAWSIGAPLAQDDFEDGDYTANPLWTTSGGSWSVVTDGSTKKLAQSATGAVSAFITAGSAWTNYSVTAKIKPTAYGSGSSTLVLGGRWTDSNNRYNVAYYPATNQLKIVKRVAGTATDLASKTFTMNTGTEYTVKFSMIGSALKVYVNGTLELSATDGALTSGKIYLATFNAQCRFDDVIAVIE
jgi:hypothetical protein